MDTHLETLAAWMDAEPVQHGDVMRALETADGREYVVDLMALRRLVAGTTPVADARPVEARPRAVWRTLAAAAAAAACLAGGFAAGRLAAPVVNVPVMTVVPAAETATGAAPTPTRIIRFEEGVDWRETIGGN